MDSDCHTQLPTSMLTYVLAMQHCIYVAVYGIHNLKRTLHVHIYCIPPLPSTLLSSNGCEVYIAHTSTYIIEQVSLTVLIMLCTK